ncbi:cytochrome P450 [Schizophyllum commune H4-8]|uniref:cytochrome P450 n=1 Tax=Schizophyllum commune (strain H4-8 / FGSC 9210) TaxID=578458 RepID=UPI00215FD289|nr:cytochrome P450 [Schizophyllum commune H4-8]KAI5899118.1 cytochrome P450 [Schizophyllum commune H4-8]
MASIHESVTALSALAADLDIYKSTITCVAVGAAVAFYRSLCAPVDTIPGPPRPSLRHWLLGHITELLAEERSPTDALDRWFRQYGHVLRIYGTAGTTRILTTDPRALHHIVTRDEVYHKPEEARFGLARVLGDGVLVTEGEKHRQQRKIMNPAFGPSQIRELTPVFLYLAEKLRDRWTRSLSDEGGQARLNVLGELSLMTLDVIGRAGFGYDFNALDGEAESNELSRAFATLIGGPRKQSSWLERAGSLLRDLQPIFPALRFWPAPGDEALRTARATMDRIGRQLLSEAKAKALVGWKDEEGERRPRDLLSFLVRANLAESAKERMSDEDVLAQVPTFLVAGHETTATATTWAIYHLTQDLAIQNRLRDELHALDNDAPSLDELNSLPYLDMFVKEVLRFYAPVPWTARVATRDDVVPLARPYTYTKGREHEQIVVRKGQQFMLSIHNLHRAKEIWGDDADQFRPERWETLPDTVKSVPSVWNHLFTFSGGPHACIGFRFSIAEIKAILFVLVRSFEFELAVDPSDIKVRTAAVQRPALKSEPEGSAQLPVFVRLAS